MRSSSKSVACIGKLVVATAAISMAISCKTSAPQDRESNVLGGAEPDRSVEIEPALGEEAYPNETAINAALAKETMETVKRKYDAGGRPARRDAHPKHHGCVIADFKVNDTLPPGYARGVFQPGKSYKSWIRFSNGSSDATQADIKGDARGMAIKLTGVPGTKLLADEADAQTQDFVMINHPVFFSSDPESYLKVVQAAGDEKKLKALVNAGFRGAKVIFDLQKIQIPHSLEAQYFSMVPYKFGMGAEADAIKFSARPCAVGRSTLPANNASPNFLRERMEKTLKDGSACFEFLIQKRGNPDRNPVEDPITEWNEKDAPFVQVATITIGKQIFNSAAQQSFCENLSYTPWHALPEHKPLGNVNRTRKVVYTAVSKLRHQMNNIPRTEPTGDERFQ